MGIVSSNTWTTEFVPPAFIEFNSFDEEGEESKEHIALRHIVSIENGDGVTRINTSDGVTHYVAHTYKDVLERLGKGYR